MSKKGFVYFVQGESGGPIKIGFTTNFDKRITMLQNGYPEKLTLLACTLGTEETEEAIHVELQKHRLRGEWFNPHDDVLAKIASIGGGHEVKLKGTTKKTCAVLKLKEIEAQREKGLTAKEMGCLVFLIPYAQPRTGKLVFGRNKRKMKREDIRFILNLGNRTTNSLIKSLKNKGLLLYDKGYHISSILVS